MGEIRAPAVGLTHVLCQLPVIFKIVATIMRFSFTGPRLSALTVVPQWDLAETLRLAGEVERHLRGPGLNDFLHAMCGDEPARWDAGLCRDPDPARAGAEAVVIRHISAASPSLPAGIAQELRIGLFILVWSTSRVQARRTGG